MKPRLVSAARWGLRLAALLVALILGALLVIAWIARSMRELAAWHREIPDGEFERADERAGFELADYLELERALFESLGRYAVEPETWSERSPYGRYVLGGPQDPSRGERNWNRTFELEPDELRGGFLLLHGLTDSPYSLRSLGELLRERGYYVLALRLPGHGTVPAALLDVEWEDWAAAARIGARHVAKRIGADLPFHLAGYSCGGALAMRYVLDSFEDPTLPRARRAILISPALGVTAFARASNWHRAFSWIPAFEKSRWLDIYPEFDPYKYNSFPKNAGRQMWELASGVRAELGRVSERGRSGELPAVLAFQSVVDSTVLARELLTGLFDRLPANGSELVVFDLNRTAHLDGFYTRDHRELVRALDAEPALDFRFTVVTNEHASSNAAVARSLRASASGIEIEELGIDWPPLVYSLSHVALPFPPDDPTYGIRAASEGVPPPLLGSLMLRGESGALAIPPEQLLRLRYNPFHAWLQRVVAATLAGDR